MTQLSSRTNPRVSFHATMMLQPRETPTRSVPARTHNISQGGMFVSAEALYSIGTEIDATLSLADATAHVCGRVAWVRPDDVPARPRGMGIEFVDLSLQSSRLLNLAVQHGPLERQEIKLHFQHAPPIRARGLVIDHGLQLTTRLPFLQLCSPVRVSVRDGEARGTIENVDLRTGASDGVPRLQIDVALAQSAGLERRAGNDNRTASGEIEIPSSLPPATKAVTAEVVDFDPGEPTLDVDRTRPVGYPVWVASAVLLLSAVGVVAGLLLARQPEPSQRSDNDDRVVHRSQPPRPPAVVAPPAPVAPEPAETADPAKSAILAIPDDSAEAAEPRAPVASLPSSSSRPLIVTLEPRRARLGLSITGSAREAEVYPLANPRRVADRQPHGELVAGLGSHPVRQGPFGSQKVLKDRRGTRVMLFFRGSRERRHRVTFADGRVEIEVDR